MDEFLYRIEGYEYPYLQSYEIMRVTAHGVWIKAYEGERLKFVNLEAEKKFACETVTAALDSFQRRKKRQIKLLIARAGRAEDALRLSEEPGTVERLKRQAAGDFRFVP